jgi:DNA (cytosine-5)-methyltransferase 1
VDAVAAARPRLLDLFCGAGGASTGYHRAGFDVTGVDIRPMRRYPFKFIHAGAFEIVIDRELLLAKFDAIHASPPCQDYSRAMRHLTDGYPRYIDPVRDHLKDSGLPWIIENVPGAPLPTQTDLFGAHGTELCGTMFSLPLWRHRLFETSFPVTAPRGCNHAAQPMNPHRAVRPGGRSTERAYRTAMGVEWMSRAEAREAIPPAYAEHIGRQLLEHLAAERAA